MTMRPAKDANYWLARGMFWGAAFGLAAAAILYQSGNGAQAIWCAADDEGKCFREWVSALGGWAAVIAAAPTVYYLARQISETRRHERNNVFIQLRRQRLIAERAIRVARGALTDTQFEIEEWHRMARDRVPMEEDDLLAQLNAPRHILNQPPLQHFEREIDVLVLGGAELQARALEVESLISGGPALWSGDHMVEAANRFLWLWESMSVYLENVIEHAQTFLRETDEILR